MSKSSNLIHVKTSRFFIHLKEVRWLFHLSFCLYFSRVLLLRLLSTETIYSEDLQFGGPFRYLTICVFTLQVFQLIAVSFVDCVPYGLRLEVKQFADDMSCATFVLANLVTVLYYTIEAVVPGGLFSASLDKSSAWIDISMHFLNSVAAWADIIISYPRRFSFRSLQLIGCFSFWYTMWISLIKYKSGAYPYGFLNTMPEPIGLLLMIGIAVVMIILFFHTGRKLSELRACIIMVPEKVEDLSEITAPLNSDLRIGANLKE
eukprot:g8447.t1